ncbi:hypothetical protein BKA67DRAFT_226795 [Truncatella angustata]|uniref:ATP-dependent DNA ligase family profile domain-containing protein n=1 Tax=Truncatella angustata TaxID=152316 RepID=A0A9P8UN29_9PEZI|nr:uncharacterized protein BKA67DRAFT_226795 [Truncatella angustata]KAH6655122.1 hypothetical protein BKA67DRAFT_226795 [Truncatella angustata]
MPFPFRLICDLLQKLDDEIHSKKKQKTSSKSIIEEWFREYRELLDAPETDAAAILSTLIPEKRTDRVYGIQANRLESIVGRALCLGTARLKQLREWEIHGLNKDLADCVEEQLTKAPNPRQREEITVEHIDETLHHIAASCRFSSAAVQSSRAAGTQKATSSELDHFYARLSARDAKWFTRLILKNFASAVVDEYVVCKAYNPRLPQALAVRDDFAAAITLLKDGNQASGLEELIKVGVKVGRQPWLKARSINHCAEMIGRRQISCEQKIDGEYCQIHIDLGKPKLCEVQIFSKSGKDSTKDRENLHRAIRESLRLGQNGCLITKGCILEGELVVYSDKHKKIMPFHKIRKHVSRSGAFIGTHRDSQRHFYEHLMIIYYDVLMIDDVSLLGMIHSERIKRLSGLVTTRKGHAELVQRQTIDFHKRDACKRLREAFAKCVIARGEGLVLKPDDPYFDFNRLSKRYVSCAIKLKKEYLQNFGDVGDFAVIGASYDAATAKRSKVENIKYTHFFVACLENLKEVQARTEQPKYIVTNVVTLNDTQLKYFRMYCNPAAVPLSENTYAELRFQGLGSLERPTYVFPDPPVFDVYCFSFEKSQNSRMWTMRFPQVSKIHFDRSLLDVLSFEKLQEAARAATEVPEMEDSQEMCLWLTKIEKADPKSKPLDYDSQATVSTISAASTVSAVPSFSAVSTAAPKSSTGNDMHQYAKTQAIFKDTPAPLNPQRGLVTPPRSSANTAGLTENDSATTVHNTRSNGRKRVSPVAGEMSPSKKSKTSSQGTKTARKNRQPLDNRSANDSQRKTRSSTSASPPPGISELDTRPPVEVNFTSSVNGFLHTANRPPSSPSGRTPRKKNSDKEPVSTDLTGDEMSPALVSCGHIKKSSKCAFENCIILLAPCISNYAWIQDLLKGHGILGFATDPGAWAPQALPASPSAAGTPRFGSPAVGSSDNVTVSRLRKVCLVEMRRPGATNEFMRSIEAAGLTRRNGQRDWVSVYDWRILEDITKIESGAPDKGPDPWRSRYVGLA